MSARHRVLFLGADSCDPDLVTRWGATGDRPFWLRLDRAGRRVGVLDVPLTPITPVVNGFHVAEWGIHDLAGPRACLSSASLQREVERVAGVAPVRDCEGTLRTAREVVHPRDSLMRQAQRRSHCAGHQMWHLHDPAPPRHVPEIARQLGGDPPGLFAEASTERIRSSA